MGGGNNELCAEKSCIASVYNKCKNTNFSEFCPCCQLNKVNMRQTRQKTIPESRNKALQPERITYYDKSGDKPDLSNLFWLSTSSPSARQRLMMDMSNNVLVRRLSERGIAAYRHTSNLRQVLALIKTLYKLHGASTHRSYCRKSRM